MENKHLKRALLINDLSCFGKCSLTVSIPILSSQGIETIPLPTLTLSNHTGFDDYYIKDNSEELINIAKVWKKQDIHFDLIYTGFFKDYKQINEVTKIIHDFKSEDTLLFVDPILGEKGKLFKCFDDNYLEAMKNLVKEADFIAPNITEASLLTNSNVNQNPIDIINKFNNDYVVITGIKKDNKIGYLVKNKEEIFYIFKDYINEELHGTGDVFSSFLCAYMLSTKNFKDSAIKAADITDKCIKETIKYLPEHRYGIAFEDVLNKH